MELTGLKGGKIYIRATDVSQIHNTADYGDTQAATTVFTGVDRFAFVRESVAEVIAAMEAERASMEAERAPVAGATRLALRAVAAGLEAAATQVRGDDPSPVLRTVARMLFSAAQELGAHGAALRRGRD